MTHNRSVPTNVLLPHLVYQDVGAAIDWLSTTFGFVEHYRYGDPENPQGAQIRYGEHAWMMLSRAREDRTSPDQLGIAHSSLTTTRRSRTMNTSSRTWTRSTNG